MPAQYSYHKLIVYQKAKQLDISLGSLAELDFHFDLSFDLGYLNQQILNEYLDRSLEITRLLRSFQKTLRAKL